MCACVRACVCVSFRLPSMEQEYQQGLNGRDGQIALALEKGLVSFSFCDFLLTLQKDSRSVLGFSNTVLTLLAPQ